MNAELPTKIVLVLTCARVLASVEYLESQALDIDRTSHHPTKSHLLNCHVEHQLDLGHPKVPISSAQSRNPNWVPQ